MRARRFPLRAGLVSLLLAAAPAGAGVVEMPAIGEGRYDMACSVLGDGRVLVIGGRSVDGGTPLRSTVLYDPLRNTWSFGADLSTPRAEPVAVMLTDGGVLVTGGANDAGALASTEVFDPATQAFSPAAPMLKARVGHTATRLSDGRVLVVGGPGPQAELFTGGQWLDAGTMALPRRFHTTTELPDGGVFVAGGVVPLMASASVELFDRSKTAWRDGGQLATPRAGHSATWLPATRHLAIVGGGATPLEEPERPGLIATLPVFNAPMAEAMPDGRLLIVDAQSQAVGLYDDVLGYALMVGMTPVPRVGSCLVMLPSGRVMVIGGSAEPLMTTDVLDGFDAFAGAWTADAGTVLSHQWPGTVTLPDGKVMLTGGDFNPLTGTELFDPTTSSWQLGPVMPSGHWWHQAKVLDDGRVLVAGGFAADAGHSRASALYDPGAGAWTVTGTMVEGRSRYRSVSLPGGRVLAVGGETDAAPNTTTAELYDVASGTWSAAPPMHESHTDPGLWLLHDGRVMVATGYATDMFSDAETLAPGATGWTLAGSLSTGHGEAVSALLPDGRPIIAAGCCLYTGVTEIYDLDAGVWRTVSPLPKGAAFARASGALLRSGRWLIGGGSDDSNVFTDVYVFDPLSLTWSVAPSLPMACIYHSTAPLPDGRLLVAGCETDTQTAIFDELAAHPWAPTLGALGTFTPGETATITGALFTGPAAGSFGASNAAPANFPLLMLERVDGQMRGVATTLSFTATSARVQLPAMLPGAYRAWVVVSGVGSSARSLRLVSADAGTAVDGGSTDGGAADAGSPDAGSADAGSADAGSADAGSADGGSADAGSPDAGSPDAGSPDAGSTDAGAPAAGSPDAGPESSRGYSLACSCNGAPALGVLSLLALALRLRRRTRATADRARAPAP